MTEKVINREKTIIKTGIIGIIVNILLAVFKALVGVLSHSIAITMDAVNNLTDAISSIVTVVGIRLAGQAPDYKHPYGHGRIEYMSAMVIAAIILYAGITAGIESVKKIINPVTPDYTAATLTVVAVAIAVKIILGRYVLSVGKKVNSGSLEASGKDALNDSVISAATLLAAIIYLTMGIRMEAYLGVVIAAIIIKAGIDVLRETISQLLGERIEKDLSVKIKRFVREFEGVKGAFDLVLHNYGPNIFLGSIHIEVADDMTIRELDVLTRDIMDATAEEFGVVLTAVSIYADGSSNLDTVAARAGVSEIALSHEFVKGMHGFYKNDEDLVISFDIVVGFEAPDMNEICDKIKKEVEKAYPEYKVRVHLDIDMSD